MINKNVTDNVTETDEQKIIRLIKDVQETIWPKQLEKRFVLSKEF